MKRGFLVIAIITAALVVGLATVRFSPWLRTQFGSDSCPTKEDPGARCSRFYPQQTFQSAKECADGKDNDGDTLIDKLDPDCNPTNYVGGKKVYVPTNRETVKQGECFDTRDNDADGLIDGADPACQGTALEGFGPKLLTKESDNVNQCEDNLDNDGDGRKDIQDAGCHQDKNPLLEYVATNTEAGEGICADGKDNDADGKVDANDPRCHLGGKLIFPYLWFDDREAPKD